MSAANVLDAVVGFYRRANGKRPWRQESLAAVFEMIRTGDLWKQGDGLLVGLTDVAVVRATALEAAWAADVAPAEDGDRGNPGHATYYERKAAYSLLKGGLGPETLSGATFSGVYQGCRDAGWESHSGIIVYDLDHLSRQGEVASDVRDRCARLTYVLFAFISPSGDGVKAGILVDPVPTTRAEHLMAWEQGRARLMEDLGLPIAVSDPQAKNPSRLCFLGHDPGIVIADPKTAGAVAVDFTKGSGKTTSPGPGKTQASAGSAGAGSEQTFSGPFGQEDRMRPHPDQWRKACPWLQRVGHQLQGECPECGGIDRFHVHLETHLWQCRKCDEAGKPTWPWYAAFTPWYRPIDFTGPGKDGPWECSADADSLRLIRRHADELLLVESDEGGSFILMADNGHGVWRMSDARLSSLLLMTTREWARYCVDAAPDEKTAGRVARWVVATANNKHRVLALASVSAMAGWLAESGSWPRGMTRCRESDLDIPGALYIGAPNGLVGLSERRLLDRTEGRSKLISRMITDDVDLDATHPDVGLLFSHLDPKDRRYLLDSFGFGLRGRPSRRFFFLDGIGNDGKSTMANAMIQALGDYAGVAMATAMFNTRNERADAHSAHLLQFQETPIMFIAEPPDHGFNWGLVRRISGGDMVGARQPHAPVRIRRKRQFIATCFFYSNPDTRPLPPPMVTRAMHDRYRLLDYPHIPKERQDDHLPNRLREVSARQALAALIIRHSMAHLDGPPSESPGVARNRREVRRASLGEMGEWLLSRLMPTENDADRVTTDDVWEAAFEASKGGTGDGVTAWGKNRRQMTDFTTLLLGKKTPKRGRINGKVCHYWGRLRLLSDDEAAQMMEEQIEARREAAEKTASAYTTSYCRVCRLLMLEVLQEPHLIQHTEEELRGQHPCFRCETLLLAGDPFKLLCTNCEGQTGENLEIQADVMAAIAAEMEQPEEGIAVYLQAQVDLVRKVLQGIREEEMEEDAAAWWSGMDDDPGEGENGGG